MQLLPLTTSTFRPPAAKVGFSIKPRFAGAFFMDHRLVVPAASMLLVVILVFLAYWPGLTGWFVFDDYQNIVLNQSLLLDDITWDGLVRAALSSGAGPTGRPLAQVSFALNYYLGGIDPFGYKFVNVLIHALNGILVFILASRLALLFCPALLRRSAMKIGFALALLWALHPLNVSTVLYVVQRMTSLAATFTLLTLIGYVGFRVRLPIISLGQSIAWMTLLLFLMLCGVYTKESAALTPYFILLVEYLVFRFECNGVWRQRFLRGVFAALVFVPVGLMLVKTVSDPAWIIKMHAGRDYLLADYLLSQGRVLWFYLQSIFVPNIAELGLYHDDFVMSRGLFLPVGTALALLGHGLLLGIAWWARGRYRIVTFGILWFYVGHLLESTILPLMLVFEHRNYLPSLGPLAIAVWAASLALKSQRGRLVAIGLATAVLFSLTVIRAHEWGDLLGFSLRQAEKHPQSARANFDAGRTLGQVAADHPELVAEYGPRAMEYFERAANAQEKLPEPYMAALQLASYSDVEIPAGVLGKFAAVLREERPPNNVFYLFSGLRDIYFNPRNPITVEEGIVIFEAARENPRLQGKGRGHMLASYAMFLRDHELDNRKAQALAEEAATLAPGFLDNRILAAWLSYENGDTDRARRYLNEVEVADRFKVLTEDVRRLRLVLDQNHSEPNGEMK